MVDVRELDRVGAAVKVEGAVRSSLYDEGRGDIRVNYTFEEGREADLELGRVQARLLDIGWKGRVLEGMPVDGSLNYQVIAKRLNRNA